MTLIYWIKKSELVNTSRHQSKLLLKRFKKNRYSERSDTMDWYLVFNISSSVFDVSVCCNIFCGILTYSPFQKHSVFPFGLYNIFQQELQNFKVFYSLIVRWSATLKGVNNMFIRFFRSIVKCKLWVAYRSYFLNHCCYM